MTVLRGGPVNADQMAPVTRAELHFELEPIRESLTRIDTTLPHLATNEYVLKAVLGMIATLVALLGIAVGILLKYGS